MTKQAFRDAMAQFSSAVSVLTTNGSAGRSGITATSVCSVTDEPPTLLVCINRNSATNAIFKTNEHLCVNVLNGEQEEIARHFAGMTNVPMQERFSGDIWHSGHHDLPVLKHCLATLEGRISQIVEVGTHSIYLVELNGIAVAQSGDALVYFNRQFHRVLRPRGEAA